MGWKLSLWACQQVLEYRARLVPGVSEKNAVVDHPPHPGLEPVGHAEHADNLFAFGKDRDAVKSVAEEAQQKLHEVDLPTHPVEAGPGGHYARLDFL